MTVYVVACSAVVVAADAVVVVITDHAKRVLQLHAYVRTVVVNLRPIQTWLCDFGDHVTNHQLPRTVCTYVVYSRIMTVHVVRTATQQYHIATVHKSHYKSSAPAVMADRGVARANFCC